MPLTVVLDNGAATLKVGLVGADADAPTLITNAVVRSKGDRQTYCGHEIARCRDYAALHYRLPFEKVPLAPPAIHRAYRMLTPLVGIPRRLGRAEGRLGRRLLGRGPRGERCCFPIPSRACCSPRAQVDTTQATLLVTEPYFNLPNIQDTYDQLVFEEYEFAAYYRCTRASASPPVRFLAITDYAQRHP